MKPTQNPMTLNFEKYADGLIPTIVQNIENGAILMVGFVDQAAEKIRLCNEKKCRTKYMDFQPLDKGFTRLSIF